MPRYYFHVRDGLYSPDEDGTDLPDLQSAKRQAVAVAGELLRDSKSGFSNEEDWQLDVVGETGSRLLILRFHVVDLSPPHIPGR